MARIGGSEALNDLWEKLYGLVCESKRSKKRKAELESGTDASRSYKKPKLCSILTQLYKIE